MKAVVMPALGVAMTEGVLLNWLKASGDAVAKGEAIAEIETDKTTVEIESPSAGTVGSLLFEPGAIVPVGAPMTHIMEPGDAADADDVAETATPTAAEPVAAVAEPAARELAGPAGRMPNRLSPRERMLARAAAEGTAAVSEPAGSATPGGAAPSEARPPATAGKHRELIAAKVAESWQTIPHFGVTREVDATAMVRLRERWTARTDRPSFTDLMLRALALALRESGVAGPVDVGLAVATPQGVAIPVVRDVLALDLGALRRAREEAVTRARNARLTQHDLTDPPRSTLSNLGPQGIDGFTGIIALGQLSLLTVGRVAARPVVVDGGLAVRDSFFATLNVDHRSFDGDDAARLLISFVDAVEDIGRLEKEVVSA